MKYIRWFAIVGWLVSMFPAALAAEPEKCPEANARMAQILSTEHKTELIRIPMSSKHFISILVNAETGAWTMLTVQYNADHFVACTVAYGTGGIVAPPNLYPTTLGSKPPIGGKS